MSEQPALRVYSMCIVLLAVEWVIFGSLHFTLHEATIAEIPGIFPFKLLIVGVTGMIEVATGILILLPQTRKLAAQTSLILLTLFLPSICKMLIVDEAIPGTILWRDFVRVLLVPNHVFMALCAIYLWRTPESLSIGPAHALEKLLNGDGKAASGKYPPARKIATPLVASVLLAANGAGFLSIQISSWNHASAFLWAMMCLSAGALIGFLFGVPRVNLEITKLRALRPNSNIEVVSDWLTKIIVGVGLVEIRSIGQFIRETSIELSRALAPAMPPQTEAAGTAFATGLIVYFFVAGVIQGYLLTRMYLTEQFQEIDQLDVPASSMNK